MFRYFESEGSGFAKKLAIAPEAREGTNWFTVFIAENGGRKSFLLRCLVEAALGNSNFALERRHRILLRPPERLPARVIAISGTPLDRFPRAGTRDLKVKRRRSPGDFVYLGPRASNGMAGLAQSERSLVGSLLSNRHRLKSRAPLLHRAFHQVGLVPQVDVYLLAARSMDVKRRTSAEDEALGQTQRLLEANQDDSQEAAELWSAISEFKTQAGRRKTELAVNRLRDEYARPSLRITAELTQPLRDLSVAMWELLLRLGSVEVGGTVFRKPRVSRDVVPGDQLSSGQWGWLGAFGSLVAEMRDHSFLVVDEPENSLHPRWQQTFISELQRVVAQFEACQVVVATHSPLIASGVSGEWGSIRTLSRPSRAGALVKSEEVTQAFGWTASDVYDEVFGLESTRAPGFLVNANTALAKLGSGAQISAQDRDAWIAEFEASTNLLPAFDPMREVLGSIVSRLRSSPVRNGGRKPRWTGGA